MAQSGTLGFRNIGKRAELAAGIIVALSTCPCWLKYASILTYKCFMMLC